MPRTTDPLKYPPEFLALLDRALQAPVVIPKPTENGNAPAGLRGYLQAFLRACEVQGETSPLAAKARQLSVSAHPGHPDAEDPGRRGPHVIVQKRSETAYARAVASALGTSAESLENAAQRRLLESLNS